MVGTHNGNMACFFLYATSSIICLYIYISGCELCGDALSDRRIYKGENLEAPWTQLMSATCNRLMRLARRK